MLISLNWVNSLLTPGDVTPEEFDRVMTVAGFPIEGAESVGAGDTQFDIEVTSNRGDCLSHLGVAREIAAATDRSIARPEAPEALLKTASAGAAGDESGVDNRTPEVCPRFTARLIRGVKVGPSPAWLVDRLEAVGQRSINNIVDASNYVLMELGNPSHAFDLNTLAERRVVVRYAEKGETLVTLDEQKCELRATDLVVADAQKPVSLAGVIGGLETGVTEKTTDILLELATWDPVTIRTAARRLRITTDACHRFERIVDPASIDFAAARLAGLIVQLAGGAIVDGFIDEGAGAKPAETIELRAQRCRDIIGVNIRSEMMVDLLRGLEIPAELNGDRDTLVCSRPSHRPDLTREIDLIEEVARANGYDEIPIDDRISLEIAHPQETEVAERELGAALAGMGFYETITFSFVTKKEGDAFLPKGRRLLHVDEERRKGAPFLRPSVWPSLMHCRRVNQDAGVRVETGVRLFEFGSGYSEEDKPGRQSGESRTLSMLMDAPDSQQSLRQMRGVIETAARRLGGDAVDIQIKPGKPRSAAEDADASAEILLEQKSVGTMALINRKTLERFGLDEPVVVGELALDALLDLYPPRTNVEPLPSFPSIERDLSLVVDESTPWSDIAGVVESQDLDKQVGLVFVGTYRGKQVGVGKKSVTLRIRFQDPDRTLRHEEVDPQIESLVGALKKRVSAEIRGA